MGRDEPPNRPASRPSQGERPAHEPAFERHGRRLMRHARAISVGLSVVLAASAVALWALRPAPAAPAAVTDVTALLGGTPKPGSAPVPADVRVGAPVPTFDEPSLRPGQPTVVLTPSPGQPVVVNFFASWCHPCQAELPLLRQAWQKVGHTIRFVGVDVNDSRAAALALADSDRLGYQLASDSSGSVAVRYHLVNLPDTVFVDGHGRIVHTQVGQLTPQILATWLGRLR